MDGGWGGGALWIQELTRWAILLVTQLLSKPPTIILQYQHATWDYNMNHRPGTKAIDWSHPANGLWKYGQDSTGAIHWCRPLEVGYAGDDLFHMQVLRNIFWAGVDLCAGVTGLAECWVAPTWVPGWSLVLTPVISAYNWATYLKTLFPIKNKLHINIIPKSLEQPETWPSK
jgi:hypothetical protein